jgi:16S rRNA (guanine(966)-N(2))-methyltransferase RsmD
MGLQLRPTTDLAKESLFNILNNHIDFEEIAVLDLFAGTGNISYEFASRQAKKVVCIEINNRCVEFITKTANELNFNNLMIIRTNVFNFLSKGSSGYDVIFADPPYDLPGRETLPELVFGNNWLKPEGWLIVEHDKYLNFSTFPHFFEERRYGKVHFSFFLNQED